MVAVLLTIAFGAIPEYLAAGLIATGVLPDELAVGLLAGALASVVVQRDLRDAVGAHHQGHRGGACCTCWSGKGVLATWSPGVRLLSVGQYSLGGRELDRATPA